MTELKMEELEKMEVILMVVLQESVDSPVKTLRIIMNGRVKVVTLEILPHGDVRILNEEVIIIICK